MYKSIFIAIVFLFTGCKTKQVSTREYQSKESEDSEQLHISDILTESAVNKKMTQFTSNEIAAIFSSLNVGYNGSSIDDKLNLLFTKTDQGTELSISGKGTANISENKTSEIQTIKTELFAYQDSIIKEQTLQLKKIQSQIIDEIRSKEKDVKTNGFQPIFYITGILLLITGVCLGWFIKGFKNPLKMF